LIFKDIIFFESDFLHWSLCHYSSTIWQFYIWSLTIL